MDFDETITTRDRFRELAGGEASERVAHKTIDHIDDICQGFIALSPFIIVSSRGHDGLLDVSPKGDPAGFVAVLDRKTLAIPDRLGNRRFDTFENLMDNPEIGLLFIIPGNGTTLRVSGTGKIVRDRVLQERLAMDGKPPEFILIVTVGEAFMHCSKSMMRSGLWKAESWPESGNVPSLAQAMVVHGNLKDTIPDMQRVIDTDEVTRLY